MVTRHRRARPQFSASAQCLLLALACSIRVPAQTPVKEPPESRVPSAAELAAFAGTVDPGSCPDVLYLIPDGTIAASKKSFGSLATPELANVLSVASIRSPARWNAALVLLSRAATHDSPAELLAEIRACLVIAEDAAGREGMALFHGVDDQHWTVSARDAVEFRARSLCARLLRQHRESPEAAIALGVIVPYVLFEADARPGYLAALRLGEAAPIAVLMAAIREAGRRLDFGRWETLQAQGQASLRSLKPTQMREARCLLAESATRLGKAKELAASRNAKPNDVMARLRLIQAVDAHGAVALSRQLIAEKFDHALPYAIAASDDFLDGRREAGIQHLEEATARPEPGALAAGMTLVVKGLGIMAPKAGSQASDALSAFDEADAIASKADSEEAAFYRWLREHLKWGAVDQMVPAMRQLLPAARELQASRPDRSYAYSMLLAAIRSAPDRAAARRELLRPIPEALEHDASLAEQRAATYVAMDIYEDRRPVVEELDAVLADLARSHGDNHAASYLRGVRAWWEAMRPGADGSLKAKAREHFLAARVPPGHVGYQRVEIALAIVDLEMGRDTEFVGWDAACDREGGRQEVDATAVRLCVLALLHSEAAQDLERVERYAEKLKSDGVRVSLESAIAAAHAMERRGTLAKNASRRALAALAERSQAGHPTAAVGRGVLPGGRVQCAVKFDRARPSVSVTYEVSFLLLPRLPDLKRLRKWADLK